MARQPVRECKGTLNHGCGSSSNGSCQDVRALGARSDDSAQLIKGSPLRLRGRLFATGLFARLDQLGAHHYGIRAVAEPRACARPLPLQLDG